MSERRRPSLLESIKSPLTTDFSLLSTSDNSLLNNDPFELNSSIWNNNTSSLSKEPPPVVAANTSSTATNASFLDPFSSYNTQARRSSDLYPQQQQTIQNYTVWSNNLSNAQTNAAVPATGNLNEQSLSSLWSNNSLNNAGGNGSTVNKPYSAPRRFSLDSYANTLPFQMDPNSNSNSYMNNDNINLIGSRLSSPPPTSTSSGQFNQPLVNESTPQLIQVYKQLDFYFVQDPHHRISITVDSLNTNNFESLMLNSEPGQTITLPKFQNTNSLPSQQLVLVSFKCGRIDVFYLPENSPLILKIGDLIIVEADRGKDLGKVVKLDVSIDEARLLKYLQFMEQQAALNSFSGPSGSSGSIGSNGGSVSNPSGNGNHNGNNNNGNSNNVPTLHFPKPILRLAFPQEVLQLLTKLSDEEKANKICVFKIDSISNSTNGTNTSSSMSQIAGNMQIIDAEYQFDRRKLTFYYAANHRIDFRDLVRDLFRVYKTRIWMCAVNTSNVKFKSKKSPKSIDLSSSPTKHNDFTSGDYLNNFANDNDSTSFGGFEFNQNIWSSTSPPNSSQKNNNGNNVNLPPSSPSSYGNMMNDQNNSINGYINGNMLSPKAGYGNLNLMNSGVVGNGAHGSSYMFDTDVHNQYQQQEQSGYYGMNSDNLQGRFVSNSIWN